MNTDQSTNDIIRYAVQEIQYLRIPQAHTKSVILALLILRAETLIQPGQVDDPFKISSDLDTSIIADRAHRYLTRYADEHQLQGIAPNFSALEANDLAKLIDWFTPIEQLEFDNWLFLLQQLEDRKGDYYATPDSVAQLIAQIIQPGTDMTICDPAVGTGSLLYKVLDQTKSQGGQRPKLVGIDIDPTALLIAHLGAVLRNERISLINQDSLRLLAKDQILPEIQKQFDIVICNPPFNSRITDPDILKLYAFTGVMANPNATAASSEILFLNLCVNMVKSGGRLAIVMPYGFLFNKKLDYVRQWLLQQVSVKGIITLLPGALLPYTGISVAILFAEKTSQLTIMDTSSTLVAEMDIKEDDIQELVNIFRGEVGWE